MKGVITSILFSLVIVGGAIIFVKRNPESPNNVVTQNAPNANNVSIVDGKQIIDIRAKGGYQPRKSVAKAGIPTVLRFDSKGTFDCSASVRIPSMKISQSLDFSGSTDIDIGVQKVGVLKGSCTMGMYPFEVEFQA